jgi:hypothetical protein
MKRRLLRNKKFSQITGFFVPYNDVAMSMHPCNEVLEVLSEAQGRALSDRLNIAGGS